jgi:hypothetical protein
VATGCTTDGAPGVVRATADSPSIAFESVDGPPAAVFTKFVGALAAEAESRQLAVVSRQAPATYRVRVYVAANVIGGRIHYDWVWDVYDADCRRTLRIAGEEPGTGRGRDAWASIDDQTLTRLAHASMDRLVGSLISPAPASAPSWARAFVEVPDAAAAPGGARIPAWTDLKLRAAGSGMAQ